MSCAAYTVVKLYRSANGHLAQVARREAAGSAGTTAWIWIEPRRVVTLQAVDADAELVFSQGRLEVRGAQAALHWTAGITDALLSIPPQDLPPDSRGWLDTHLS